MRLKDKVAIITGSTRGIGYSIAEAFVKEGAKVVLCGSSQENADKSYQKILEKYSEADVLPIGVNLTSTEDIISLVEKTINKYGKIDVLVNNAGITGTSPITELSDEDFEKMMNINVFGAFKLTREVVKKMKEYGGSIINTSSMVANYGGRNQVHYSASKGAINAMTKSLSKELGMYNIRVNAVLPGVTLTDMTKDAVSDEMLEGLKRMIPLGRASQPEELAGAYVYLASDEASFTTGTLISVDGGIVM
ncbi:MAG: 3-oxoacyl-ACP reductase FabG [Bacilli bacterium]|nr:3-oxoacyl-ACP reductase FabG [Bacilli bacterium]